MNDKSWIKFYRKTFDNAISTKPNYLAVWVYVLSKANHKEKDVIIDGKKITLNEGEFLGSLRKISDHFSLSIATVKTIIDYLESEKMLNTERTNKYTIFQILNYGQYQNTEHKLKSNRNQTETNNNDNNDKNERNILFDDFWFLFPRQRRGDKQKGFKAFERALKKDSYENIMAGLRAYAKSDEVSNGYAKGCESWLNDSRWLNEYHPARKSITDIEIERSKRGGFIC